MNKRRRYKAKSRRRWARLVGWQIQPLRADITAENIYAIACQMQAAIARAMGVPRHYFGAGARARDKR